MPAARRSELCSDHSSPRQPCRLARAFFVDCGESWPAARFPFPPLGVSPVTEPAEPIRSADVAGNPFATRWVRPGAIPFLFPPDQNAAKLVERLRAFDWRGQIVGPHGSGKSTLLHTLRPELERAGREVVTFSLAGGQRRLDVSPTQRREWTAATLVVIDGFEPLNCWNRLRWNRQCRRAGAGLLVTTHCDVGLPTIAETTVTLETAQAITARLLAGHEGLVTTEEVAERFAKHAGNLRETLFDLYDLVERRQRGSG